MDRGTHALKALALGAIAVAAAAGVAGATLHSVLWTDVGWTTAALGATAALACAARRTSDPDPGGWRLLVVAGASWFLGQVCWDLWTLGLPLRIPADAGWLGFAVFGAIGMARVASFETGGRQLAVETIPVVAASGTLIVALLYGDVITSSMGPVERWITLGYPVMYSAIPIVMAQVLLAGRIRIYRRPDLMLICLGVATQAAGFTLWAPELLHGTYVVGGVLDTSWTFGLILIAAGGLLHATGRTPALQAEREHRSASILPGALFVALLLTLLAGSLSHWQLGPLVILEAGALLVGGLIGLRLASLTHQQRRLLETERRTRDALEHAAEELAHVALHDPLTKLPNRTLFLDRTTHALSAARRAGTWTAVLFLDVDDFKRINDVFGHSAGDELLSDLSVRLVEVVRPGDTVARFGGDEFTILCPGLVNERHAVRVARRITQALAEPFLIGGRELHAAASVGIAYSAAGDGDAEALVRDADTAMYRAKERGGGYEVFDESVRARVVGRVRIEDALRGALERKEMRLAYQPVVSLDDSQIRGFEALLRWESPTLGNVSPSEFIPIAEQSGQIVGIGEWVLDEACAEIAALRRAHPGLNLQMAVNVSARQVLDPLLPRVVRKALRDHNVPPHALALEITESDLIEDGETVLTSLGQLRSLGVQLMLDDFGTGFSSLAYLKRFPVDVLKIDRSFVDGLGSDGGGDTAIAAAIVGVAHALRLEVIAEGVETQEQAEVLMRLGCGLAQGFRYARPTFEPDELLQDSLKTVPGPVFRNASVTV